MRVVVKPANSMHVLSNIKPSGLFWVISTSSGILQGSLGLNVAEVLNEEPF